MTNVNHQSFLHCPTYVIVDKAVSVDPPHVHTTSMRFEIVEWNSLYDFKGVSHLVHQGDHRVADPIYLVFKTSLDVVIRGYHYLTIPLLGIIAQGHQVKLSRKPSRVEIERLMRGHRCHQGCENLFYVFKQRSRARPVRPWAGQVSIDRWESTRRKVAIRGSIDQRGAHEKLPPERPPPPVSLPSDLPTREETVFDLKQDLVSTEIPDMSHLDTVPEPRVLAIVKEWQREMAPDNFIRLPCAACSGLRYGKDLQKVHARDVDLSLLRNDELPSHLLPESYDFHLYDRAILEPKGLEEPLAKGLMRFCRECRGDLSKGKMPKFALCNWLYYAREKVPKDVYAAFKDMSVFEKAMICRVRTNSLLCRFGFYKEQSTGDNVRFDKRHIRGNIISTPFDVGRMNAILPPSPSEIRDTVCALFVSTQMPSQATVKQLRPILVRKSRVKLLIEFLLQNNPHYRISESFKGYSSEYLEALFLGPEDEGVPTSARIGHLPIKEALEAPMADYTGRLDDLEGLFMENVAYTTGDMTAQSYREMTMIALQRCREGRPFVCSRSGTTAVPDIDNPNWLSWAHPDSDPYGIGGFNDPRRKRRISMGQQLRHLISVEDPFFEKDYAIAFDVYNILRKSMVNTSLRFRVPISSYARVVDNIIHLNREVLATMRMRFLADPFYQPQTREEKDILRIMTSITPVAKQVPGSTSQRIRMRSEIRSLISQRGSPTLFITLNPADHHHPIVRVLALRCATVADLRELPNFSASDRMRISLGHPAACAQFFDSMIKAFIRIILRHGRKEKKPGLFGHCEAYYGTVETQGRGSLHCHMLVWLKGHLPPEVLADRLKRSNTYRNKLSQWIDSVMTSGFLGSRSHLNHSDLSLYGDLDPSVQSLHPGSHLGPQSSESDPQTFRVHMLEHVDELLLKFQIHKHTGTCWKYLRPGEARNEKNCRFGLDGTVSDATEIDPVSAEIRIRRTHPRMTQFNPTLTFLMKCNTDLKFIGSGGDAMAFMYYVTDYITKAPLSMHAGLTALAYAIRICQSRGIFDATLQGEQGEAARRAITVAINSMLGHQELSHPQVMSFILGCGESYSSDQFHPVNWSETLQYVGQNWEEHDRDPSSGVREEKTVEMKMNVTTEKGTIVASNQLLDYIFRPESITYESMSLYTFWSTVSRVPFPLGNDGYPRVSSTISKFSSNQHPQFRTHGVRTRTHGVVPVLLGPKISRRKGTEGETESWSKDMCILFKPWRTPATLKAQGSTWYNSLQEAYQHFTGAERSTMINMSLLSEAKVARDQRPRRKARLRTLWTNEEAAQMATSMQEDSLELDVREGEGNVYSVLQEPILPYGSSAPQSVVQPFQLEVLLGKEVSTMFDECRIEKEENLETMPGDEGVENRGDSVPIAVRDHQIFMTGTRDNTKAASKGKKGKSAVKTGSLSQPGISTNPNVTIENLRGTRAGSSVHSYDLIERLVCSEGLKENKAQTRAFQIIAQHVLEGQDQLLMYVGGKGGTGKSHIVNTVVKLFTKIGRLHELRLGAPTGIAAALIGGSTLHSLLYLGPSHKGRITERLTDEWRMVRYLIVDEVSMVGAQFMASMSSRLSMAKGDIPRNGSRIFGGISIIFTGDFCQLAPPKQPSLFSYRLVRDPTFMDTSNTRGIDSISGAYLWRRVETVVHLKKNVRQLEDPTYAKVLTCIRDNKCLGVDGIQTVVAGKTVLQYLTSRLLENVYAEDKGSLRLFSDAPVIVGSKTLRDALNVRLLTAHASGLNRKVHLYYSTDKVKGHPVTGAMSDRLHNMPARMTREHLGKLPLFIGMRVMVLDNVSVPYKVVNGSEGTVKKIIYSEDSSGKRRADVVYVELKSSLIEVPGLEKGVVPIFSRPVTVKQQIRVGEVTSKSYRRFQIPLAPAYSYTDYKSQGRTLDTVVVDLATSKGQGVYVMLSRVKSLKGLIILRPFPSKRIFERMSGELREELDRLDLLERRTKADYKRRYNTGERLSNRELFTDAGDELTEESDSSDL